MDYAEAVKTIESGERYPVYLLYGPEDFESEKLEKLLIRRFVTPEMRDFNFVKLFGGDITDKELINTVSKFPMMAEYQCVVCTAFDKLKITDKELLPKFFKNPVDTTVLILRAEKVDKRTSLYKTLQKTAFVFEAKKKYENQIVTWIESQVRSKGGSIEPEAAEMLFGFVGANLRELDGEIEKILLYKKDDKRITEKDVGFVAGFSRELSAFELANVLVSGNFSEAYKIGNRLLQRGEPLVKIISGLYFQFNKLWQIAYLTAKRKSEAEISRELKLNAYFLRREKPLAIRVSLRSYQCVMKTLSEYDMRLKSVSGKDSAFFGGLMLHLHKCLQ